MGGIFCRGSGLRLCLLDGLLQVSAEAARMVIVRWAYGGGGQCHFLLTAYDDGNADHGSDAGCRHPP